MSAQAIYRHLETDNDRHFFYSFFLSRSMPCYQSCYCRETGNRQSTECDIIVEGPVFGRDCFSQYTSGICNENTVWLRTNNVLHTEPGPCLTLTFMFMCNNCDIFWNLVICSVCGGLRLYKTSTTTVTRVRPNWFLTSWHVQLLSARIVGS